MRWLGFAGSGVTWIALLVVGVALALRFSWARVADAIGERVDGLLERRQVLRYLEASLGFWPSVYLLAIKLRPSGLEKRPGEETTGCGLC